MTTMPSPTVLRTEIVFIESNVADYQTLLKGINPAAEVHVLDASKDGLTQMAQILEGRGGIDAIHLISHGAEGTVQLGALTLNEETLQSRASDLAVIGSALTPDGDLLLYGCNVAQGKTGVDFIGKLAQVTGADVAGSNDLTGTAAKGGDWVLENQVGAIDTALPLAADAAQSYGHVLALFDLTNGSGHDTKVIRETVVSDEIVITAKDYVWWFDDEITLFYEDLPNVSGKAAGLTDYESEVTVTVTGDKIFDLASFSIVAGDGDQSKNLIITTDKGTATTTANFTKNPTGDLYYWDVSFSGAMYQGISWAKITTPANVNGGYAWGFDNFVLNNITAPGPTLTSVTSSKANGSYKAGEVISIQVTFSEAVTVTGTPQLTLETGTPDRIATYASNNGSGVLTFTYTVQAGDTAADLDYLSTTALAQNGGSTIVATTGGATATLTLPALGAAGSLGGSKAIVIDTTAPTFDIAAAAASATTTGFTPSASLNESGTLYYVVLANNATAPSATEVMNGTASGGGAALANSSAVLGSSPFTSSFAGVTGLKSGTAYDLYMVAKDAAGNLMAAPTLVDISTSAATVTLSVNNASIAEATGVSTVTATLSAAASADTTVTLAATGTATGGGTDYTLASTTITISAGATTGTTTVTAVQDLLDEADETVILNISAVSGGGGATENGTQQQTVTITDDDAAPTVSIADTSWTEGNSGSSNMTFTVTLNKVSGLPVLVNYGTTNGTATAGSDYTAASGVLTFNPGVTSQTFTVAIAGDTTFEPDETITATLLTPTNATLGTATATGTITNDDAAPNAVPTLTAISTLTGATEDTAHAISYDTLLAASNYADADGADPKSFRVEAVTTGTLYTDAVLTTPVVAGTTLLSTGGTWYWKPAADANGSALNAFTVKAYDGTAASSTAIQVKVDVADVDPSITAGQSFSVDENSTTGTAVGTVAKTGDTNGLIWTITGGTGQSLFDINSSTGAITVKSGAVLDYETTASYALDIAVDDEDVDTTSDSTQSVTVNLNNVAEPEVAVTGNSTNIGDGDAMPITTDHTDFGSALVTGGTVDRTFTINNTGTANLTLGTVTVGGTNASDFTVTSAAISPVAAGGSTTFTVHFDPSAAGARTATVSFVTNDGDENPFNFSIQGTGTTNAAPVVTGLDGDTTTFIHGTPDAANDWIDSEFAPSTPVSFVDADFAGVGRYLLIHKTAGTAGQGSFFLDIASSSSGNVTTSEITASCNLFNYSDLGNKIATVDGSLDGQNGNDLKVNFVATALQTSVADLIKALQFNAPNAGQFTFELKVFDGAVFSNVSNFTMRSPVVVNNVTSSTVDGSYHTGQTISIQVTFDRAVTVNTTSGTPTLTLETGTTDHTASYVSGNNSTTLTFEYVVQAGDTATDLDFTATTALNLNSGTIIDAASGANVVLTLSAPAATGSLGANKALVIDGNAPTDIALSNASVSTSAGLDAAVGTLSSTDDTVGDSFTYALVAGAGSTDNASFNISGAGLRANDAAALSTGNKAIRVQTTDAAGNTFVEQMVVTVTTNPTVTITSSAATVKAGDTATITFTFSETPTGFADDDITISGGTLSTVTVNVGDNKIYTATFTPTAAVNSLSGSILVGANKFTNASTQANVASNTLAISGDTLAPSVTSIVRQTPSAASTNADSLTWRVTFSEAMSNLDTTDFSVSGTNATITAATSAGANAYDVTASGGDLAALNATVTLAFAGGHNITDSAGNALASTSPTGTSEPSYTVDNAAPTLTTVSIASNNATNTLAKVGDIVTVSFTTDGTQSGSPTATINGHSATVTSGSGNAYTATYTLTGGDTAGAVSFAISASDAAGNAMSAVTAVTNSSAVTFDKTAPALTTVGIASNNATNTLAKVGDVVTVSFTADGTQSGTPTATINGNVATVTAGSGNAYTATYTLTGSDTDGAVSFAINASDAAGNAMTAVTAVTNSSAVTFDKTAPALTTVGIASNNATNTLAKVGDVVTVSFTTDGTQSGTPTATINGNAATVTAGGGNAYTATYTLTGSDTAGAVSFAISASDAAGNAMTAVTAVTNSSAVTFDKAAPTLGTVTRPTLSGPTGSSTFTIDVAYADAGSGLDASSITTGDITVTGPGAVGALTVSGASFTAGTATYTLNAPGGGWSAASHAGNYTVALAAAEVKDLAGNAVAANASAHSFAVSFNAAPSITSNGAGATAAIDFAELRTAVTTVTATDADSDTVSFQITGGADQLKFNINSGTGALTFASAPDVHTATDSDTNNSYLVEVTASDGRGGTDMQALTVTVLSDIDRDGTPDVTDTDIDNDGRLNSAEDPVPNANGSGTGDGNGDGTPDREQINVASLGTTGTADALKRFATIEVASGLTLTNVANTAAPGGLPRNVKMPLGQFDFDIGNVAVGGTVSISMYVEKTLGLNGYYKLNGTTWTNIATATTVGNKTKLTFSLTDGGLYDADGIANGIIKDPGGAALIAPVITSNGGNTTASVNVAENSTVVTTVVSAIPPSQANVSYGISGGADASNFNINPTTGALSFTSAPNFEAPADTGADNSYEIIVQASDGQGGSDTQTLTVNVTNVNEAHTGSVTISGTPTQGETLTASHDLSDPDGPATLNVSYQWFEGGAPIAGGTASTLVLSQAQVGRAISVQASYTDALGNGESQTSSTTAPVTNTNDAPTGSVTLSGTPTQGQTLTAANTLVDPDGLGTIGYEWSAGGVVISGASGSTLVLGQDQVGKAITVKASYTDGGGTAESISSAPTAVVVNINDAPTGAVSISGTPTQGQTLTAANTLSDADGPATLAISYQWQANGVDISGATSGTLLLGADQLGKTITVVARYTDAFGAAGSVISAASAVVSDVAAPNTAPTLALSAVLTDNRILENTNTTTHILVANIAIADDTQGNNTLSLSGADAASFELVGTALYLKAGVVLDFETQTSYQLAVQVADASLPASTPASAVFTLTVVNVEEGTPVIPQPEPTPVLPPVTEWPSLPDDDGDGTPEALEGFVKPLDVTGAVAGDGNGDGVADAQQQSVASVPFLKTPTAISSPGDAPPVFVSLVADSRAGKPDTTDANTAQLQNVVQKDAPTNLPSAVKMPLGLISFDAVVGLSGTADVGVTETFSLYVDSTVAINGYWKLDASNTWVNLASSVYGGAIVSEGGKTRLDFKITDGGQFDADHAVNGTIVDPGAAGYVPMSLVGYAPDAWISLVGYAPDLPTGGFWF